MNFDIIQATLKSLYDHLTCNRARTAEDCKRLAAGMLSPAMDSLNQAREAWLSFPGRSCSEDVWNAWMGRMEQVFGKRA